MQKIIFIAALLLAVNPMTAFAEEAAGGHSSGGSHEGSEFFYQAHHQTQDVTGAFAIGSGEVDYKNPATTDQDTDTMQLKAEYEYGITTEHSLGIAVAYSKTKFDGGGSTTNDGLNDLEVIFKGHALEGALRYGAVLEYALDDSETKANGDANNYTGGAMLQPYIGYQLSVATGFVGVKLARDIEVKKETEVDKTSSPATETETEGGEDTIVSIFYEHILPSSSKVGAKLIISKGDDTTEEDTSTNVKTDFDGIDSTELVVYGTFAMGSGEFLPSLGYEKVEGDGGDITGLTLTAAYRLPF